MQFISAFEYIYIYIYIYVGFSHGRPMISMTTWRPFLFKIYYKFRNSKHTTCRQVDTSGAAGPPEIEAGAALDVEAFYNSLNPCPRLYTMLVRRLLHRWQLVPPKSKLEQLWTWRHSTIP